MSTNPFDDENGSFVVLENELGRRCLWPSFADVPGGWTAASGPQDRRTCLEQIGRTDQGVTGPVT